MGRVKKTLVGNGKPITVIFENAFHSPSVAFDLVSISRLDSLGYTIMFGNGEAKFYSPQGTHFMTGVGAGGLYRLDIVDPLVLAARSRSLNRPVDLETWHRRFAHAGIDRIRLLEKKGLVDGLTVTSSRVEGKCVDCW